MKASEVHDEIQVKQQLHMILDEVDEVDEVIEVHVTQLEVLDYLCEFLELLLDEQNDLVLIYQMVDEDEVDLYMFHNIKIIYL